MSFQRPETYLSGSKLDCKEFVLLLGLSTNCNSTKPRIFALHIPTAMHIIRSSARGLLPRASERHPRGKSVDLREWFMDTAHTHTWQYRVVILRGYLLVGVLAR
jgi:hypothetical protein